MIIKSRGMSIKAVDDVLSYIMREDAQLIDNEGRGVLVKQHLRGKSIEEWAAEFRMNERTRKYKNKKARGIYHCILSLHPDDSSNVTASMLIRIAKEFIRLRCPNSLAIITAHMDAHIHLHVLVSGVEFGGSGKSIRIERSAFSNILQSMSSFQEREFPELKFSKIQFGKKSMGKDAEYQMKLRGNTPERELVIAQVKASYTTSQSFTDFLDKIEFGGFTPYKRNGRVIGVQGKRKYRFSSLEVTLEKFRELELER
jgi:hypothetical protein